MNHVSDLTEVGLHSVKFTLNNNNYRNEYRVAVIGSTHVSIQNKFNCMNCFQILCINCLQPWQPYSPYILQ